MSHVITIIVIVRSMMLMIVVVCSMQYAQNCVLITPHACWDLFLARSWRQGNIGERELMDLGGFLLRTDFARESDDEEIARAHRGASMQQTNKLINGGVGIILICLSSATAETQLQLFGVRKLCTYPAVWWSCLSRTQSSCSFFR